MDKVLNTFSLFVLNRIKMGVFENYYFPSEFKTRYEVGAILI